MKFRIPLTLVLVASCPMLLAPTAVPGGLGPFGQGTPGGQNPGSWGIPQSGNGQSSGQQSGQQSGQRPGQGTSQGSGQGSGQSASQGSGQSSGQGPAQGLQGSGQQGSGQQGSGQQGTGPGAGDGSGQGTGQGGSGQSSAAGPTSSGIPADWRRPPPMGPERDSGSEPEVDPNKGEPNYPEGEDGVDPNKGEPNYPEGEEPYDPLDPSDGQYDPMNQQDRNPTIPSSCAEDGSACQQCVRDAEENIQFNRRYLHVAWSITHSHIQYANRMMAIGDTGSNFHGAMALSWQLGGKPQILEAVAGLRQTYKKKYQDYFMNIRRSVEKLSRCEQDNFAINDLYQRFGSLYLDMIQVRYESPEP